MSVDINTSQAKAPDALDILQVYKDIVELNEEMDI